MEKLILYYAPPKRWADALSALAKALNLFTSTIIEMGVEYALERKKPIRPISRGEERSDKTLALHLSNSTYGELSYLANRFGVKMEEVIDACLEVVNDEEFYRYMRAKRIKEKVRRLFRRG